MLRFEWLAGLLLLAQPGAAPFQLTDDAQTGQRAAIIQREPYTTRLLDIPLVDPVKLERLVGQMEKAVYRKPINATIGDNGGIVKESPGARLNRQAFIDQFYANYYAREPLVITIPFQAIYPKVDSELLASIRVRPIGYYVTYFNSRNHHRFTNLKLAAQAINNYVVLPGETFSFNQVVGMRTRGRGYMSAKVIVRGEFSEGIGGGICQISSTLYNAVDRAGLRIIERYSHSRSVPYVPHGRDATVNWGGPDFSFRNDYNEAVLIRAHAGGGQVVVQLFSSENISVKPRHVPGAAKAVPEEVEIEDPGEPMTTQ
ncbi:VanW family protein [Paenibacillus whitsoniae]|uniref:Peptidoglycan binding domain-containing protein n=1 Tax=Paenibacillus whitsoniae TaxID=2496558 RepID=A0A430JKI0_9BACL|nr:VanW family protein [Paenibacillus whitsoniae]RTE11529.1 hypothetical protein EJQ19_01665 [Paenibacillus whitsoniae]